MIDLNTVLNNALTQALNDAMKPLRDRIEQLETSVRALDVCINAICNRLDTLEAREGTVEDLENTIDARISDYLENNDLAEFVDASNLEWSGLDDHIEEKVRDLIAEARISI